MAEEGPDVEAGAPLNNSNISRNNTRRQTLKDKMREVSVEKPPTSNPCEFIAGICAVCLAGTAAGLGLCLCLGLLAIVQLIPLGTLIIGILYWDDRYCTAEPIPLLLVIGGSIHLAQGFLAMFTKSKNRPASETSDGLPEPEVPERRDSCVIVANGINQLLSLASFAWFIAACVIVYRLYSHVDYNSLSASQEDYCHKVPYLFAFWLLTSSFIILGILVGCLMIACCCGIALAAVG